jgi:hypothetical protein
VTSRGAAGVLGSAEPAAAVAGAKKARIDCLQLPMKNNLVFVSDE